MNNRYGFAWPALAYGLIVASLAHSLARPKYPGSRALGMGGAFTALSDDWTAIHYNPAGLSFLNTALDAGVLMRFDLGDAFGVAGDALTIAGLHANSFSSLDSLANDNTLADDLMRFDRRPVQFGTMPEMHFAARSTDPDLPLGIAASWFLLSHGTFQLDKGIYIPSAEGQVRTDLLLRFGGAIAPWHGLSIGVAPTIGTYSEIEQGISIQDYSSAGDSLLAKLDREQQRIYRPGFGFGLTLGAMYEILPTELRVGMSVQDLFLALNDQAVPSAVHFGMAYLPAALRKQGALRYVNFAVDIEDAFGDKPFLTKLVYGAEMNMSLAQIRGGFRSGYPCYGLLLNLFIVQLEFTSFAEELGLYPGQWEDRHYLFSVRLGI
jgi:hypothetical protein